MGIACGKPTVKNSNKVFHDTISSNGTRQTRKSRTESKIQHVLIKKKLDITLDDKPMSIERVLLKFDKIRDVLRYVKLVFDQIASDGKIDNEGLQLAMQQLNVNLTLDEMLDLFDFVDVHTNQYITIKEFLVALTVGLVLDIIPSLSMSSIKGISTDETATDSEHLLAQKEDKIIISPGTSPRHHHKGEQKSLLRRSISRLLTHVVELKEMLNLIVIAYLLFDPDGKGFIEKQTIENMFKEQSSGSAKGNWLQNKQNWNNMKWTNGTVDFAEFVYEFTTWVDIEEESL